MSESESENETYFDSDSSEDPEGMYGNESEYSADDVPSNFAILSSRKQHALHRAHNIKSSSCSRQQLSGLSRIFN